MRKTKRMLSGILAAALLMGMGATNVLADEVVYPLEEEVTLTFAMVDSAVINAYAKHLFDTPLGQAWQEATGVNIEVIQCADQDALNLLIAGGELPDLIYYGGTQKAVKDGIIEPLNDYLDTCAPDLKAVLESNDLWRKSVTTSDGDVMGGPFIRGDDYLCTYGGLMVRQDWLDDLGLDVPETPDEFYEVLKAFKEEKGATIPWTVTSYWLKTNLVNSGTLTSPFGLVKGSWYQIDGEIHLGSAEAEYKDVLAFLNKLYEEGLLDADFISNDDNICRSNMANGTSGVTAGASGGYVGTILSSVEEENPEFDLSPIGSLVAESGDKAMSGQFENPVAGKILVMTTQCENKEAAAKFINYAYTEEGHNLLNFGIEGVSYEMVDGYPTYTELITNNPDGLTMQQALAQYTMAWADGPMVQDKAYMEQYATRPQQQAALAKWSDTSAVDYFVPNISVAEEDQAEYNKLWADIDTYISEMFVKYITGQASLDDYETEYLGQLEKMGIDRVIELQQNALDVFNAN